MQSIAIGVLSPMPKRSVHAAPGPAAGCHKTTQGHTGKRQRTGTCWCGGKRQHTGNWSGSIRQQLVRQLVRHSLNSVPAGHSGVPKGLAHMLASTLMSAASLRKALVRPFLAEAALWPYLSCRRLLGGLALGKRAFPLPHCHPSATAGCQRGWQPHAGRAPVRGRAFIIQLLSQLLHRNTSRCT